VSEINKDYSIMKMVGWFQVFNATFNNISVISWRSVLLVEETGVPRGNHRTVTSRGQTLSNNVVLSSITKKLMNTFEHIQVFLILK
jgi:hypothetical protein